VRAKIDRARQLEQFSIEYRAAGTQVLDCFLPNRAFTVSVDRGAGALAVTVARGGARSALVIGDNVYLHRTLFAEGLLAAEWLRVPRRPTRNAKATIERAIGVDLTGYLFAEGLPPTGEETALAVLDVATEVASLSAQTFQGRRLDGYRVIVDPGRFAVEATAVEDGRSPAPSTAVSPVVEFWVGDDGEVVRLSVRHRAAGRSDPDAASGGWTTDYLPLDEGLDVPAGLDASSAGALDVSRLRPPSRGSCELGIGPGDGRG